VIRDWGIGNAGSAGLPDEASGGSNDGRSRGAAKPRFRIAEGEALGIGSPVVAH